MNSSTASTLTRLITAAKPGSWRDLSNTAVASLVAAELFDADAWELTEAGRAMLAAHGYRANGSRVEVELDVDVEADVAAVAARIEAERLAGTGAAFDVRAAEAEALRRATGSVAVTVRHERRLPTGELVVDVVSASTLGDATRAAVEVADAIEVAAVEAHGRDYELGGNVCRCGRTFGTANGLGLHRAAVRRAARRQWDTDYSERVAAWRAAR